MQPSLDSRIRVVIDGMTMFDGNPGEWRERPPDLFKDMVRPGVKPQPWMKSISLVMMDAVMIGQSVEVNVRTSIRGANAGWSMEVFYR